MCLEMMPSWCGQVNWGNCGINWVNCAVLCVWKTTGKDSSEACAIASQNCAVYSVFPSGMTSHSKIAQFDRERIVPLTNAYRMSVRRCTRVISCWMTSRRCNQATYTLFRIIFVKQHLLLWYKAPDRTEDARSDLLQLSDMLESPWINYWNLSGFLL